MIGNVNPRPDGFLTADTELEMDGRESHQRTPGTD